MKRLLIITAYYPPLAHVAGHRYEGFVRHLPEFGWTADVLTFGNNNELERSEHVWRVPVYRWTQIGNAAHPPVSPTSHRRAFSLRALVYRLIRPLFERWLIPDGFRWFAQLRLASVGRLMFKPHHYHAILVSCAPFSLGLTGKQLSRRFGAKLFLDFRDGLTLNPYETFSERVRPLMRRYEESILSSADGLVTTTPSTTKAYQQAYPALAERMQTVTNGFDEELFSKLSPSPAFENFTLLYAGVIDQHRSVKAIAQAFISLKLPRARFLILGSVTDPELEAWLRAQAGIEIGGQVPRAEAIRTMLRSHMLVLQQGLRISTPICYPVAAKTYEYIRTGVPILCVAPPGDNCDIIRAYCRRATIVHDENIGPIAEGISRVYGDWVAGRPNAERNSEFETKYERRVVTGKMAKVLDNQA